MHFGYIIKQRLWCAFPCLPAESEVNLCNEINRMDLQNRISMKQPPGKKHAKRSIDKNNKSKEKKRTKESAAGVHSAFYLKNNLLLYAPFV